MKKSFSEQTVGTCLRRAEDMLVQISSIINYNPPNPEDQAASIENTLTLLNEAILVETEKAQKYRLATEVRQKAFHSDKFSVMKSLKYLRAIIEYHYPSNSRQSAIVLGQIRAMRPKAPIEIEIEKKEENAPAETTAPTIETTTPATTEQPATDKPETITRKVSRSQTSFASLTIGFQKLVKLLEACPYQTDVTELTFSHLQTKALSLPALSDEVTRTHTALKLQQNKVVVFLDKIDESIKRIKNYTKFNYGIDSDAYASVKDI